MEQDFEHFFELWLLSYTFLLWFINIFLLQNLVIESSRASKLPKLIFHCVGHVLKLTFQNIYQTQILAPSIRILKFQFPLH